MSHIEVGAILRASAEKKTEAGKKMNREINQEKKLVSDEIIDALLRSHIGKVPAEKGAIIDGAPRKKEQIKEMEGAFAKNGRKLDCVIFIDISPEESFKRIFARRSCSECGKDFILGRDIHNEKEKCSFCGGMIIQRKDDTSDGIKKRLEIFSAETRQVIEHYRQKGILLEVDGNKNYQEVFADILSKLKKVDNI